MKYNKIMNLLIDPENGDPINLNTNYFYSKTKKYYINDGIPDFFLNEPTTDDITNKQKEFYEDVKFPNYDDLDDFSSLIEKSENSLFAKKLDQQLPHSSKIIEIGCGTGQMSNFLSRYNRVIVGTDISKTSLDLANEFKKKNQIANVFFLQMNLFKPCFKENSFDAVISNGCLHHTANPREAFKKVCSLAKTNGFIVIGLYHKNGRFFTRLRQKIFNFSNNRFKFLDSRNINQNLSLSKRYAWYRDQYQNPKEFSYSFQEIYKWFEENNIKYLSSIPFHNFDENFNLLKEQKKPSNFKIRLKEISMTFDHSQIKEGGFFIMVGKKNN
ncbi:methyltransferase domain-containing protein [Candidatus Pelagibacter sp.]|nr:methyltransferase domain-containing protein [Candidatus Pelagibacter sp.]